MLPVVHVTRELATLLKANMEATGVPVDSDGFAAHHIVPHGHSNPDFALARDVLNRNGIHFDEAANGVSLPHSIPTSRGYAGEMGPPHQRIHNGDYARELRIRLQQAEATGADLRDELQRIAAAVADPNSNFPGVLW